MMILGFGLLLASQAHSQDVFEAARTGNIRQLKSVLESGVNRAESETLMAEDIDIPTNDAIGGEVPKNIRLTEVESWAIKIALERNGWNQTQAAKILGIHRETLLDKMKKYKIAKGIPKTS